MGSKIKRSIQFWLVLIGAVLFVAASAQISFDLAWQEVRIPITGQSFAVLVAAMLLGRNLGLLTIIMYLLLGGFGLPFFADGASGWIVFTKGSGGFLFGFVLSAFVVGWLADLGWRGAFAKALLAMIVGTVLIVGSGLLWLTHLYGWSKALEYGFYPFVWGALVKVMLGALVVFVYEKYKNRSPLPGEE